MKKDLVRGTVQSGFEVWMNEPLRAGSARLSYGAWWRTESAYWLLSWIEDTGELCAVELGGTDRFIILGNFEKKAINALMRRWFDGDNLGMLIRRCAA
jgi:hypothetical protein